jgi:hypothetical protein
MCALGGSGPLQGGGSRRLQNRSKAYSCSCAFEAYSQREQTHLGARPTHWTERSTTYLGNYEQARQLLDSSLALHYEAGDRIGIASTLAKQGALAARGGESQTAKSLFLDALQVAVERKAASTCMQILSEIAALLAHLDSPASTDAERAAGLAAFILRHAASDHVTKEAASRLLAELEVRLSPSALIAVQEPARERTLEEATRELLREAE